MFSNVDRSAFPHDLRGSKTTARKREKETQKERDTQLHMGGQGALLVALAGVRSTWNRKQKIHNRDLSKNGNSAEQK
jgi:hypothetical protein